VSGRCLLDVAEPEREAASRAWPLLDLLEASERLGGLAVELRPGRREPPRPGGPMSAAANSTRSSASAARTPASASATAWRAERRPSTRSLWVWTAAAIAFGADWSERGARSHLPRRDDDDVASRRELPAAVEDPAVHRGSPIGSRRAESVGSSARPGSVVEATRLLARLALLRIARRPEARSKNPV
jgi:hypothetical protein